MFYEWAIAVPANTTEAAPITQEMKLTKGVITRIEIQFPTGCAGLAHCRILEGTIQKWPTPPSTSFASDGYTVPIEENYELENLPATLFAKAWNLDDTYDHTIYVRVGVLRGEGALLANKVFAGLGKMLQLMGIKV